MAESPTRSQFGSSQRGPGEPPAFNVEYLGWSFAEFPRYSRSRGWYVLMGIGGFGLLIYAVLTANFLFALILIMFAIVSYLSSLGESGRVRCALTDAGVAVGSVFYPYREISRYWFVYQPPTVRNLYLEFKSPLRPRMAIDLENQNPNEVRAILSNFVHEDFEEDEEPFSDYIGRVLKI